MKRRKREDKDVKRRKGIKIFGERMKLKERRRKGNTKRKLV